MSYLKVSREQLDLIKLEILTNALLNNKFHEIKEEMFFKTFSQLEASQKLSVGDRIWLGRQLRYYNNGKPVKNIDGIAIFQKPNQFKKIRKFKNNE